MRIAIAGAGIAGLSAAIALSVRGFSVDVFERAERLEEIGAGIQLAPNATSVLARLGVLPALEGKASEPPALVIRDAVRGGELTRLPLGQHARMRYGAPYLTVLRADLQGALLAAARERQSITINLGSAVSGIEVAGDHVRFATGAKSAEADLLIAADGVRSAIRTGLFGYPPPTSLGRTAWRALLRNEDVHDVPLRDQVGLALGARGHLVHYPVSGGALINLVVIASGETAKPPLAPFGESARDLIDRAPDWIASPLLAVGSGRAWIHNRVVLVGDAAHAMAPSAAQGGAQAIEDAWCLAAALAASADIDSALTAYQQNRRTRVECVARLSLNNLNTYEAEGVPAFLRNFALRGLPTRLLGSRLDWLFQGSK